LNQAIQQGQAAVEEVGQLGSLAHVAVVNKTDRPILIPEGEILIGVKQDRTVNATVLIAAGMKAKVPVSCVEKGRWRHQSPPVEATFCAAPSLRSKNIQAVQCSRARRDSAENDDRAISEGVTEGRDDVSVQSPTASLANNLTAMDERFRQCRVRFELPQDASGVLVARGDDVLGLDLFDCPGTFQATWQRLSAAYFFDALQDLRPASPTSPERAKEFIRRVGTNAKSRATALGRGDEFEISAGGEIVGAALVYAERLCHLAAFTTAR
jgi:hypothetical protein